MFSDALLIIFIAFCTALLGEGLTYLLVYRSDEYKRLKDTVERKTKKLEKKKETADNPTAGKTVKRKIEKEEERLKATNRDMSMFKMKSGWCITCFDYYLIDLFFLVFAIGIVFTALLSTFSSVFEGRVVAKLPFHPISFVQGLSHRNLIGECTLT